MSDETTPAESSPDIARRSLGLGVLGLLGAAFASRQADAFPPSAGGEFNAASRILSRYGVKVSGSSADGHDVISFDTLPLAGTEYRQIIPCIKTSVLDETATFTHTHPGEIIPCVRTTIEGHDLAMTELFDSEQGGIQPCYRLDAEMLDGGHIGEVVATHFHPGSTGEIIPCVRTTIHSHALSTTEVFDAAFTGSKAGVPALTLSAEMKKDGVIGLVALEVNDASQDLLVKVGGNTYRLVDGALMLEGAGATTGAGG